MHEIRIVINDLDLIRPFEQMTAFFVFCVDIFGITVTKFLLKATYSIFLLLLHKEMVMVRHKTPSQNGKQRFSLIDFLHIRQGHRMSVFRRACRVIKEI